MKRLIGILALLLIVSCQPQPNPKYKTIMLRSTGEVETLPDMATFRINLSCLKPSVKQAKECLVDKSNALTERLLEQGIDKDDILTTSITLNKSYTWHKNTRVFEGYKSATALRVKVKDIDALDEIYTELLETQNLDLGGLSYNHSRMDSLKNSAYANALKKASTLADRLIDELPESKKEVLKIGNVKISASVPQPRRQDQDIALMAVNESAMVRDKSVSVNTGTIQVTATLYVEYQFK